MRVRPFFLPRVTPFFFSKPVTTYRYWKLNITAKYGGAYTEIILSEMELRIAGTDQVPLMTAATTSGVTVSESARFDTSGLYDGWRAFNNNNSDGWDTGYGGFPYWLKIDFGSGKHINDFTLTCHSSATQAPADFTLAGSNDDISYTTLDTRSGLTWTASEKKTFTLSAY